MCKIDAIDMDTTIYSVPPPPHTTIYGIGILMLVV